jgi:hypothetical protein
MTACLPPRQIAYFVADVRAAARRHHALTEAGPYFVADHIPLRRAVHRGTEILLDHTSAYGQWGEMMIEFVQQNNAGPSPFHDLYPEGSGRHGLHHVALFVPDLEAELQRWNASGHETALQAEMNDGFAFAFVDCVADHGHMIELYEPRPQLTGFYDMVRAAAESFTGGDVIRTISFD